MHQFTFDCVAIKTGHSVSVRATARTPVIARWHILNYYGDHYTVAELPSDIGPAHRVLGEIDCTSPGAEAIASR